MPLPLSIDAKIYQLTTGTRATWNATVTDGEHVGAAPASLTLISDVKDITIPVEAGSADVTTRGSGGWKISAATLFDVSIDVPMVYDPADIGVIALKKAFLTRANIALALLSGDKATVGVEGLWADFVVTKMDKGEQLEEVQMVTFTLKPGYSAVPPEWVKVAGA